jgi:hypothetical protein
VLHGQDTSLLAPEETPEEVLREREARAAAVSAVQDKLRAGSAGELCVLALLPSCLFWLAPEES